MKHLLPNCSLNWQKAIIHFCRLSSNYFPNILLLYYPLLLYNLLYIYYFYYYIIILSNYFQKNQLSVMAIVVTIMLFGRPLSWHSLYCVYRFYILDASSKIFIKYLYTSEIPHISSLNCCSWLRNSTAWHFISFYTEHLESAPKFHM